MKSQPKFPGISFHLALAAVALGAASLAWAANRCCSDDGSYAPCSGCVMVGEEPATYVNVGPNIVKKCGASSVSNSCEEEVKPCFSLVNGNLYSESGCSQVIGVTTLTLSTPQCHSSADTCGGG